MSNQVEKTVFDTLPTGSYWKRAYDGASELVKEYYRANSMVAIPLLADSKVDDELRKRAERLHEIYYKLTDEDWRYIISQTGGPSKLGLGKIWKKIRAKQGKTITPLKKTEQPISGEPIPQTTNTTSQG